MSDIGRGRICGQVHSLTQILNQETARGGNIERNESRRNQASGYHADHNKDAEKPGAQGNVQWWLHTTSGRSIAAQRLKEGPRQYQRFLHAGKQRPDILSPFALRHAARRFLGTGGIFGQAAHAELAA